MGCAQHRILSNFNKARNFHQSMTSRISYLRSGVPAASLCGLILASYLFAGLGIAETSSAQQFEDPIEGLREITLDNGLRVYTLEDHRTPVVSFQVWVQAGSKDETRYTGLAHLFEHMMFKGSKNLGPERHAQLVGSRGGRINAFTNRDVTVYHEDVTSESLPLVIDLEAERFGNLDISEKTLTSEREVVLEERRLKYEDRANGRAFEALSALAWKAHPYRTPVIGWRSDVAAVTVEACREFFDTYYAPNNFFIVIAGDFETEETLAHIRRAFGSLPRGEVVLRAPTIEPEQDGERRAVVEFEVQAPLVMAAWHAPATGHEDGAALDVSGQIFSGGRSSRLYRSLVYEAQIASYAHAYYAEYMHAGLYYAQAAVRPGESVQEVETRMFAELQKAADEGVSDEEVAKAKRQLEVSLVERLGTTHSLANRIGLEISFFGKVRPLQSRLDQIQSVTKEDVQRVLKKYLRANQRSVVWVVPTPEEDSP
jgi:predicted Zn-dependent peptidase